MNQRVVVDGMTFYRTKVGYYLSNSIPPKRLHIYVWEKANGKIPKGYCIHHIDRNKENNDITNFALMTIREHQSYHGNLRDKDKLRENMAKNVRPKADEWHGSKDGIEWHKKHYAEMKETFHKKIERECTYCGKKHMSNRKHTNSFCCDNCKMSYRRSLPEHQEERTCVICGKMFSAYERSTKKTCSKECCDESSRRTKSRNRKSI